ncbi:glycosyltransferase family 8 protein [Pelosinus sp. sgz500959]|uniref:glycosyltransferase family 8 protein n=1 Tax=Pelosinus sp. sgz500959 TaxID=3242472 RepID=UPI003671F36F
MKFSRGLFDSVKERIFFKGQLATTDQTKFNIGFGINAAYARYMGVAITSIAINNPNLALTFHVFANSIEKIDIDRLKLLSKQCCIDIILYLIDDKPFEGLPTKRYLPIPTYFRFILPKVVNADRVLYLDSDIVCLKSIMPLVELDLEDNITATVTDIRYTATTRSKALRTARYFNAGVLLIDIKKWNFNNISEQALDMLFETPDHFEFLDQDALNVLLDGKSKFLNKNWNYILSEKTRSGSQDAILLHFAANPKPWTALYDQNIKSAYFDYEKISPWNGLPLQLPNHYHDMRPYSKKLWKEGNYIESIVWLGKYIKNKSMKTLGLNDQK